MDSEPEFEVGGVALSKAQLLAWAANLRSDVGGLTVQLIRKAVENVREEAAGRCEIKTRQIHELRGGYIRTKAIDDLLTEVVTRADEIATEDANAKPSM